ncbi:uncharacterized protein LOC121874006 [Homarus americanus]|uniref:uncharacterized protein LOC121874006 n=1 Tax=Homarus americanus TaxID=6706 RepID=UPI001C445387|nr:uncharacterized protein LOC121874006 [Homarus americanus]
MNYYFSQVGRCDFYWSKESFLVTIYALIAQKDSPIITAFNARMRQILDYGLLDQWYYTILRNSTACTHAPDKITISTSISLNNIWGMFVILVGGEALGLFVLFCEILNSKFH